MRLGAEHYLSNIYLAYVRLAQGITNEAVLAAGKAVQAAPQSVRLSSLTRPTVRLTTLLPQVGLWPPVLLSLREPMTMLIRGTLSKAPTPTPRLFLSRFVLSGRILAALKLITLLTAGSC